MTRVIWTKPAKRDFDSIWDWLDRHNPAAAQRICLRIAHLAARLEQHPDIGRPGRRDGTRELYVSRTRYVVIYRVLAVDVEILRILHERMRWPPRGRRRR